MFYRLICKLVLFFVLLVNVLAAPAFCEDKVPSPKGWVNDFAGIISKEYTDKLNNLIQELEAKTSTEIAVVTVNTIAPYDEKEYARMLFDSWKPGKKARITGY